MKSKYKTLVKLLVAIASLLALLASSRTAYAQGTCVDRAVCGEVSPLLPMQSAEAVHLGLVWKKGVARLPSSSDI